MDRQTLSGMPDQELISLIQTNPACAEMAFAELLLRFPAVLKSCIWKSAPEMSKEDKEDVESIATMRVYQGLHSFVYRTEQEYHGWLRKIQRNVIADYRKRLRRLDRLIEYTLDDPIEFEDGGVGERGEQIPAVESDLTDQYQREYVIEIAERRLRNWRQKELVVRRFRGQTLPAEWKRSNIDSDWRRATKTLIAEARKARKVRG